MSKEFNIEWARARGLVQDSKGEWVPQTAAQINGPQIGEAYSTVKGSAPSKPVERESDLHNDIIEYCISKSWIYLHGSMAARTARTLGEPDFCVMADGGRVFFIECKSKTGKHSIAQQAFARHASKLGHEVFTVRNMEEFRTVVTDPKL